MHGNTRMAKALEAAAAAAEIQRGYFRANLEVEIKADKTPVTVADVESEGAIREVLTSAFPDDGFYGEETGSSAMDADYVWLVDPLDGTKSFVRGYPFFSVQIALLHAGEIVLGVSNAPLFDEIAHAEKGAGAFINGAAAHISDVGSVADASLSLGNTHSIARTPAWQRLGELVAESSRIRGYGDFYHYHLLAAGRIDAVIESDVNILDIAALSLLVTEAGGIFTDLQGQSVTLGTTSVLAANRQLHGVIFERLNGSA